MHAAELLMPRHGIACTHCPCAISQAPYLDTTADKGPRRDKTGLRGTEERRRNIKPVKGDVPLPMMCVGIEHFRPARNPEVHATSSAFLISCSIASDISSILKIDAPCTYGSRGIGYFHYGLKYLACSLYQVST